MKNRRIGLLAIMFMLSLGTLSRIKGNESIRTIQFLSIFSIGAISALLIKEIAEKLRNGK